MLPPRLVDRRTPSLLGLILSFCFALAVGLGAASGFEPLPHPRSFHTVAGDASRLRWTAFLPAATPSELAAARAAGPDLTLASPSELSPPAAGSGLLHVEQAGGISGFVLNNSNAPQASVTVELRDAAQNLLASTMTDSAGSYSFFSVVSGGTYVVRVVPPTGFTVQQVLPGANATASGSSAILITNFNPSLTYANNNFILAPSAAIPPPQTTGSISGSVIQDVDSNSLVNVPPDRPIPGVQVLLQNAFGTTLVTATTDVNGAWAFTGLSPGTYQIMQVVPASFVSVAAFPGPGGMALNAVTLQVTLSTGLASANNNFLDRSTVVSPTVGTISGAVYQDVLGTGTLTVPPDVPIPGVAIQLFTQSGIFIAQTTTAANGAYSFTNVPPGFYLVLQVVPSGLVSVSANPLAVTAVADVNQGNNNFLDRSISPPQTGTISGSVIQDVDNNGIVDVPPDVPIAGVQVLLQNLSGTTLQTFTTDVNGAWAFRNLAAGTYLVVQVVPANFAAIAAFPGPGGVALRATTLEVTIAAGGVSGNNNFLDRATVVSPTVGSISGAVYQDVLGNGVLTVPPDVPIPGVTIQLFTQAGVFIAQMTTAADGTYSFANIPPGFYQVLQVVPAGMASVSPNPLAVTVVAGINQGNNNFLDRGAVPTQMGAISGSVIQDVNGNGVVDVPPDTALTGVQVLLQTLSGTTLQTTTTDANGAWAFRNLSAGTYSVVQVTPANFTPIRAFGGPGGVAVSPTTIQVTLSGTVTVSGNNNFLDRGSVVSPTVGTISGAVYQDVLGTGTLTVPPDVPIPGVAIQLFTQSGIFIAQTTTAANGAYSFTNVPPGFYLVLQVVPSGLVSVSANPLAVTAVADVNQGNNNFLDRGTAPPAATNTISGFAIEDVNLNGLPDNEPGLAGMLVVISNQFGNPLASVVTDSSGIFRFTNVPAGTFILTATPPFGRTSTNAIPGQGGTRLSANSISVSTTAGITNYPGQLFLAGP